MPNCNTILPCLFAVPQGEKVVNGYPSAAARHPFAILGYLSAAVGYPFAALGTLFAALRTLFNALGTHFAAAGYPFNALGTPFAAHGYPKIAKSRAIFARNRVIGEGIAIPRADHQNGASFAAVSSRAPMQ